jgi:hypothetical protein
MNDPRHWRDRAEEMRRLAENMPDDNARQAMLRIADDYERLARKVEQRLPTAPKISN